VDSHERTTPYGVPVTQETTMRDEQRPTLVQRWILVTDEQGREHLERRWVLETRIGGAVPQAPDQAA
jgi:hypothetical protein